MSSEDAVRRFVGCLREARELLHDPMVRQLLEVLHLNAGEPFTDALLDARGALDPADAPTLLRAPELGLEEVSTDEDEWPRAGSQGSQHSQATDPYVDDKSFSDSPPATPLYNSPIWDPVFVAECRVLGALLRDGPTDGMRLFGIMYGYRASSRHIPDRYDAFVDWLTARPRIFRRADDGVVHAAEGADEFLSRKRDVIGYLSGCRGYKSTASAIQEAIPNLQEEVR